VPNIAQKILLTGEGVSDAGRVFLVRKMQMCG
jgi:hypothetical protein